MENTIGKKIRAYREYRNLKQTELAELSGINVGTIRKYELGIRNPKPEQLEKIATALGLNVSIFLDLNITTISDVLALLFAIEDTVDVTLKRVYLEDIDSEAMTMTFNNIQMQDFFEKWYRYKEKYDKKKSEIMKITDEEIRSIELNNLENSYLQFKLWSMTNHLTSHALVGKEFKGVEGLTMYVPQQLLP